jgi:tetratricopeptide (TPR) repeat protein
MVSNAFYQTSFLNQLIEKHGRLFPHGHMGDYNMACLTLWNSPQFLYYDFPLAVFGHWKENTTAQLHDLQTTMPEYQEWVAWITAQYLKQMPVKSYTWLNCVAASLLDMKKKLDLPYELDWTGYYIDLARELRGLKKRGIDIAVQERDWIQASTRLSPQDQARIATGITRGRTWVKENRLLELDPAKGGGTIPPALVGKDFKLFPGQSYGFQNVLEACEIFEELSFGFPAAFPEGPNRSGAGQEKRNQERPTQDDRQLSPEEVRELFVRGNYSSVAMAGLKDEWQTYAAWGLIGKTREALEGLSRFGQEEARFYSAVASWIGGDESAAVRGLERIPTAHAQNLLSMIRKPKIRVLAQHPWRRTGTQDLLTGMDQDPKFQVQNLSFHPQDLTNQPHGDVHKFYSRQHPPDFYLCQMVEWHLIPPNIGELPCPIIAQTADYDLHIQTLYPWLQLFDEMIVCDGDEWKDVCRLVPAPVSTFPKSFCVPKKIPPPGAGRRDIDFFLSGTVKSPYNPDKALLLNPVMRMADLRILLVQGYANNDAYWNCLARSKVSCTYTRRPKNTPTRGLEALAMGCALVVQQNNVLTLFAGEKEGVLTYSLEEGDLRQSIREIIHNWPEFERRARKGAAIIRKEFSPLLAGSQYLRFAAFLAAKPRAERRKGLPRALDQRRMVKWKGWLPSDEAVGLFVRLRRANLTSWKKPAEELHPHWVNLFCREIFLSMEAERVHSQMSLSQRKLVTKTLQLYRACSARFPQSLVLNFNWIRNALHFGMPEEVSLALRAAEKICGDSSGEWELDVFDDVYTWDFCNSFFNFRQYTDWVTEHLMTGKAVQSGLIRLILASLHYYLAHYTNRLEHFQRAAALDPDFPYYRLLYAQALLSRGGESDFARAHELLVDLAENSILDMEAYNLILDMPGPYKPAKNRSLQIRAFLDFLREKVIIVEPVASTFPLQPAQFGGTSAAPSLSPGEVPTTSPDILIQEILQLSCLSPDSRSFVGIPFAHLMGASLLGGGSGNGLGQLQQLKQQAMDLYTQGALKRAEEVYKQAFALYPNDPDVLLSLGRICYDQGKDNEALQYLKSLLAAKPDEAEAWAGVALVALRLKEPMAFAKARQQLSTLNPRHPLLPTLERAAIKDVDSLTGHRETRKTPQAQSATSRP